ncbi:uncharacterized protein CTHT_0029430 [Thermochaetoides thermophila DSM 1495]|uniref:Uncharacterized protein n=1 Tax=Chaetomium thermophilum (strain DSM 1495 / CBS 144.50 / IMI 039719) TaxID=759272 RepID=G0S855_CHATD|nr:hypothetical protein CTHT_0029430 [Thermochaetoides thermophila DSM 1495]EGS21102.1 hypothetical protein CTHT_0029430 [Thermochaetoides thermophila DSM 1495]
MFSLLFGRPWGQQQSQPEEAAQAMPVHSSLAGSAAPETHSNVSTQASSAVAGGNSGYSVDACTTTITSPGSGSVNVGKPKPRDAWRPEAQEPTHPAGALFTQALPIAGAEKKLATEPDIPRSAPIDIPLAGSRDHPRLWHQQAMRGAFSDDIPRPPRRVHPQGGVRVVLPRLGTNQPSNLSAPTSVVEEGQFNQASPANEIQPLCIDDLPEAVINGEEEDKENHQYETVDLPDGRTHVVGGLVEETYEQQTILFAQQLPANHPEAQPGFGMSSARHPFFIWPPPDLHESNKELDRELAKYAPVLKPFDPNFLEKYVDGYTKETRAFCQAMNESNLEIVVQHQQVKALEQRCDMMEKHRTDLVALRCRPQNQRLFHFFGQRIRETDYEIQAVKKELEKRRRALKQTIAYAGELVANAGRWDFDLPNAIDEHRFREIKEAEEKERIGAEIEQGMLTGVYGPLKEQPKRTQDAVKDFTKRFFDEREKKKPREKTPNWRQQNLPVNTPSLLTALFAQEKAQQS